MKKILSVTLFSAFAINAYAITKPVCNANNPIVEMTVISKGKAMGNIDVQLNRAKAPTTVSNFMQYVNSGFYSGKIFHRVIPNFMIQGGGFNVGMNEAETKAPIKNEANNGLNNDKYTIAMARTNDPNSATAQFFINVKDNNFLNYAPNNDGYAVFGKVISGQNVVDAIALVPTGNSGMYQNVPIEPVVIKNIKVLCK